MKNYKYIPKRFYPLVKNNILAQMDIERSEIKLKVLEEIESNKRISVKVLMDVICWADTKEGTTAWYAAYSGDFSKLEKYLEL